MRASRSIGFRCKAWPVISPVSEIEPSLRAALRSWGKIWHIPDLANRVRVTYSRRLTRSLGRCRPAQGEICLSATLCKGPRALVREILCHEAAHAAAYLLGAPSARPHGPEWAALVTAAGYSPARSLRCLTSADRRPSLPPCRTYEHLCPVCQHRRIARRPVPQWRCAACVATGLDGRLVIRKRELRERGAGE